MNISRSKMRGFLTFAAAAALLALQPIFAPAVAQTAPPATDPSAATPAPGPVAPQGLSESVVVTVNDDLISTYDIVQRMRLLIVTAGIQPNEQNLPEIQREAVR